MKNKESLKELNSIFGSYRAEWLKGKIFDFFAEPSYFNALQDNRPFVLEGGRGTGKTTVLRGLSYQGQFALHKNDISIFDRNDYIGIYHRVNTNHVRSFIGGDLPIDTWKKVFAHYFNLITCRELLIFIKWHALQSSNSEKLSVQSCKLIAKSLCIENECGEQNELLDRLENEMISFQAKINNLDSNRLPKLSLAGDPIKLLTEKIINLKQFNDKIFYLILDEYENFEDYQQQVINTFIKHNTEYYTFKIGVRELGWRVKHTLNNDELLNDPADYFLFSIEQNLNESHFAEFAKNVCEQRIQQITSIQNIQNFSIENTLVNISIEDEAIMLGVENTELYKNIITQDTKIKDISPLYKFFISYWAKWHNIKIEYAINDYLKNKKTWDTRYENYKYEMLFKIRRGRGKGGIQKYYTGWNTYVKLAKGNIRYLMELVYRAFEKHLEDNEEIDKGIDIKLQTYAAQEVGQKNLTELEGLWKNGAKLTKVLLGFGRIFQVLASEEGKSAPELNQFSIENSGSISKECQEILTASVMNLALVRSSGNKLTETTHTKDYMYTIHPIFSAFFGFSYRRKRKIMVKQDDIIGLIEKPQKTISSILRNYNIEEASANELPVQLEMFENFYND